MLAATIVHHVRFFIVSNPWEPMTDIVRWAAPLVGAFIVALAVHLKRRSGPFAQVHQCPVDQVPCVVSDASRAAYQRLWLLTIEALKTVNGCQCKLLATAIGCAAAWARADAPGP